MSDAPERIWAKTYSAGGKSGYWEDGPIRPNTPENQGTQYLRADLAARREADAYRAGLEIGIQALREFGVIDPKDAENAVEAVMSGVPGYDAGCRAGLEAAAKECDRLAGQPNMYVADRRRAFGQAAAAIRAMKDDTP
jgi:hypothetical protein